MAYHAFVAMPFGVNDNIDFNRVYSDLIQPALESAGFKVFRADEEGLLREAINAYATGYRKEPSIRTSTR